VSSSFIVDWKESHYLNPSFLYPAASAYQAAIGFTIFASHGRFIMALARDGADILELLI